MRKLLLIGLIVWYPASLSGQGFGKLKKTIVLERKLPAAVKLPGNAFDVKSWPRSRRTRARSWLPANCSP